ncbi:hypothetical protein V1477_014001 [Vespula maculifrons]|uniref:Uncharacterized protein n=1 Tax=Vespula maculifrons TaxID=7453 RepID=A0ABD2BLD8_VESMC
MAYPKLSLCRSVENGGLTRTRGIEPLATHTLKGFQPLFIERGGGEEGGGCGVNRDEEPSDAFPEIAIIFSSRFGTRHYRKRPIAHHQELRRRGASEGRPRVHSRDHKSAREDAKVWKARGDMEEMVGEENSCGRSSSKFQERDAARGPSHNGKRNTDSSPEFASFERLSTNVPTDSDFNPREREQEGEVEVENNKIDNVKPKCREIREFEVFDKVRKIRFEMRVLETDEATKTIKPSRHIVRSPLRSLPPPPSTPPPPSSSPSNQHHLKQPVRGVHPFPRILEAKLPTVALRRKAEL